MRELGHHRWHICKDRRSPLATSGPSTTKNSIIVVHWNICTSLQIASIHHLWVLVCVLTHVSDGKHPVCQDHCLEISHLHCTINCICFTFQLKPCCCMNCLKSHTPDLSNQTLKLKIDSSTDLSLSLLHSHITLEKYCGECNSTAWACASQCLVWLTGQMCTRYQQKCID